MTDFPRSISQFKKTWPQFKSWLEVNGSEILAPTNDFEAARFTGAGRTVCIIYRNGKGQITSWQNGADAAWKAWKSGERWRASKRRQGKRTAHRIATLFERDGTGCFYCRCELTEETATLEHVIPLARGGTNHLSNMVLACGPCNREAGHMTVREKLEMAIKQRQCPQTSEGDF